MDDITQMAFQSSSIFFNNYEYLLLRMNSSKSLINYWVSHFLDDMTNKLISDNHINIQNGEKMNSSKITRCMILWCI